MHLSGGAQTDEFMFVDAINAQIQKGRGNVLDSSMSGILQSRVVGVLASPTSVATASSVLTFLGLRATGWGARAANVVAPGVGALAGGTMAGIRKWFQERSDVRHYRRGEAEGDVRNKTKKEERYDTFSYDTATIEDLFEGNGTSFDGLSRESIESLQKKIDAGNLDRNTVAQIVDRIAEIRQRIKESSDKQIDLITAQNSTGALQQLAGVDQIYGALDIGRDKLSALADALEEQLEQQLLVSPQSSYGYSGYPNSSAYATGYSRGGYPTAYPASGQVSVAEMKQMLLDRRTQWHEYFEKDQSQKDRREIFHRVRKTGEAAIIGASVGATAAFATQEAIALGGRAVHEIAQKVHDVAQTSHSAVIEQAAQHINYDETMAEAAGKETWKGVSGAADDISKGKAPAIVEQPQQTLEGIQDRLMNWIQEREAGEELRNMAESGGSGSVELNNNLQVQINPDHSVVFYDTMNNSTIAIPGAQLRPDGSIHIGDELSPAVQNQLHNAGLNITEHAQTARVLEDTAGTYTPADVPQGAHNPNPPDLPKAAGRIAIPNGTHWEGVDIDGDGASDNFNLILDNDPSHKLVEGATWDQKGNITIKSNELILNKQPTSLLTGTERSIIPSPTDLPHSSPIKLKDIPIPEHTHWQYDAQGYLQLVIDGHDDQVLIHNAQFDVDGHMTYDKSQSILNNDNITETVNHIPPETKTITTYAPATGNNGILESTELKGRVWYANNTGQPDASELQLHTLKDGDALILDAQTSPHQWAYQHGLNPEALDLQKLANEGKIAFAISLPGQENASALIIPANADSVVDGILRLDPSDHTHFVDLPDGSRVSLGTIAQQLIDQNKLQGLGNGDIATEWRSLHGEPDALQTFKIGQNGRYGTISAGYLDDDGVWHSTMTIRGNGEIPDTIDITKTVETPGKELYDYSVKSVKVTGYSEEFPPRDIGAIQRAYAVRAGDRPQAPAIPLIYTPRNPVVNTVQIGRRASTPYDYSHRLPYGYGSPYGYEGGYGGRGSTAEGRLSDQGERGGR